MNHLSSSGARTPWRKQRSAVFRSGHGMLPMVLFLLAVFVLRGQSVSGLEDSFQRRQSLIGERVDSLKQLLEIPDRVVVQIVKTDERLVSVQRSKEDAETFVLSFDEAFLRELKEDELDAVIAHELGHVWIFTHHPFLQTELLANQIAMKVVLRETLIKVYEKVSLHSDVPLNMARVLGAGD